MPRREGQRAIGILLRRVKSNLSVEPARFSGGRKLAARQLPAIS
jgi:hypothetical protein